MSRTIPPSAPTPSGMPNDPNRPGRTGAGMPAQTPNTTTPKAPEVGASAPPTASGQPANKVPPARDPYAVKAPTPAPASGTPAARSPGGAAPGAAARPAPAAPAPGAAAPAPATGMPPISELKQRPISRVLTKMGKVNREQVVEALTFQKSKGGALGRILVDLGYIKDQDLNFALAAQLGYEYVQIDAKTITPQIIAAVPAQIATTQKVLPIEFDPATKKLTVAMASHENYSALDDLRSHYGYQVKPVLSDPEALEKLIQKFYNTAAEGLSDILSDLQNDDTLKDLKNRGEPIDLETLKDAADSNPVRKLINLVLLQAIKDKASD